MPDKKLTDNEIVKALECCTKNNNCTGCPLEHLDFASECASQIAINSLDLINRLQVKNKRLSKENIILSQNADTAFQDGLNEAQDLYAEQVKAEIKAEAYKEFAERSEKELFIKQNKHREHWMETLNRHRGTEAYKDHEWSIDNWLRGYGEAVQDILAINQNFLKELVGEDG